MRARDAGFTLIEMLITLAVISILAVIALPSFFGESRKTKAFAEVQPMFNDLRVRLEQYLQENGKYPVVAGETPPHPSSTPGTTKRSINPLPPSWTPLNVRISGSDQVYCSYMWSAGLAGDPAHISTQATIMGFTAPTTDWYYVLAQCDMDGDGVTFSYYFTSSVNTDIQRLNEGS